MKKFFYLIPLVLSLVLFTGCSKTPTGPKNGSWSSSTLNAPFSGRYGLAGVVFNGQMWVLGGYGNSYLGYDDDNWYSSNGSSWTLASAPPYGGRYGHGAAVLNGQIFVIGGYKMGALQNDIWSSPDGINWVQINAKAPFTARADFVTLVYNNLIWVIGGWDGSSPPRNDVWSSPDGVNWNQATAKAAFPGRCGFTGLVYNNLMWVIGGARNGPFPSLEYNDVWSSPDGVNWSQVTAAAAFSPRFFHASVAANGVMYVMGGYFSGYTGGALNDVWTSGDGANWSLKAWGQNSFPARVYPASYVFNGSIWVIGGGNNLGATTYYNDVWHSP